jgi:small subunit ribosomal protein S2
LTGLTNLSAGRKAAAGYIRAPLNRFLSSEVEDIESSIQNHPESGSLAAPYQLHIAQNFVSETDLSKNRSVAQAAQALKHVKKTTGSLGSIIEPYYEPHKLLTQPPSPKDITLELLMASQAHMGHSTSLWNPANQRYIYGIRQGIHIISLEATAAHLRRAAKVVEGVAYHGGLILFIGTRRGQNRAVIKAAELAKGCHLFERWIPGTITNGDQILAKARIRAVDENDQKIETEMMNQKLADHRSLKPDLVVCLNPLENYICLHECGLNNIPTIGIIDTDANPSWVTYPIPANDDRLVLQRYCLTKLTIY